MTWFNSLDDNKKKWILLEKVSGVHKIIKNIFHPHYFKKKQALQIVYKRAWVLKKGGWEGTWGLGNKKQRELFPKPDERSFLLQYIVSQSTWYLIHVRESQSGLPFKEGVNVSVQWEEKAKWGTEKNRSLQNLEEDLSRRPNKPRAKPRAVPFLGCFFSPGGRLLSTHPHLKGRQGLTKGGVQ